MLHLRSMSPEHEVKPLRRGKPHGVVTSGKIGTTGWRRGHQEVMMSGNSCSDVI